MFDLYVYLNRFTILFERGSLNNLIGIGENYPNALGFVVYLEDVEIYRYVKNNGEWVWK